MSSEVIEKPDLDALKGRLEIGDDFGWKEVQALVDYIRQLEPDAENWRERQRTLNAVYEAVVGPK